MNTCLVIEDDFGFYLETESILKQLSFDRIHNAKNISEIKSFLERFAYDLIISDIMLENDEVSLDYFNRHPVEIPTIFMSVVQEDQLYRRIQQESKHLFLIKPINPLTLKSSIEYLRNTHSGQDNGNQKDVRRRVLLKDGGHIQYLFLDQIKFIKSEGNYCIFHLLDRRITTRERIAHYAKELLNDGFVRCHKSFIINTQYISEIRFSKNQIHVDSEPIPIGRKYKDTIKAYFRPKG